MNIIKLTESQLHKVIRESVKHILKETYDKHRFGYTPLWNKNDVDKILNGDYNGIKPPILAHGKLMANANLQDAVNQIKGMNNSAIIKGRISGDEAELIWSQNHRTDYLEWKDRIKNGNKLTRSNMIALGDTLFIDKEDFTPLAISYDFGKTWKFFGNSNITTNDFPTFTTSVTESKKNER